jgi:hypothetical protein
MRAMHTDDVLGWSSMSRKVAQGPDLSISVRRASQWETSFRLHFSALLNPELTHS